ncbi:MAG: class I SAM-dependent methyltransferase [Bacillota bacterium]
MELSPKLYHYFVRPQWFTNAFINRRMKGLLADYNFENSMVLDFGCGIGSNCTLFQPDNYVGIDCDQNRIHYAQRLFANYQFKTQRGYGLPFSNQFFDYIFIMAVLHHISSEDLKEYLQEFQRILKPQGKIIITEPCFHKNFPFCNWYMSFWDKGKYIRNEQEYTQLFSDHSYHVERKKRFRKSLFYQELFFTASFLS